MGRDGINGRVGWTLPGLLRRRKRGQASLCGNPPLHSIGQRRGVARPQKARGLSPTQSLTNYSITDRLLTSSQARKLSVARQQKARELSHSPSQSQLARPS